MRQKGGLPGTPPGVHHLESLAAQAACTEALLPGSDSGPNCFQEENVFNFIVTDDDDELL